MTDIFERPDDSATPLTPEEIHGLIPSHIAYRAELNQAEQENIVRAQNWALNRGRDVLSEKFIRDLHRQMLSDVWRWAGKFRTTERNKGIAHWEIPIAVRFHHRLVQIHPFPNGNGRHSRLMADLLVMRLGQKRFSWGRDSLRDAGAVRVGYIEALRAADNQDIGPLLAFSRA